MISFCFEDLAGSFLFGFDFSFSCLLWLLDSIVFETPISGFLGLTIFDYDLFCETLDEAVRLVCKPVRSVAVQTSTFALVLLPPSIEVLDTVSMLL